jgi:hypothetical protein
MPLKISKELQNLFEKEMGKSLEEVMEETGLSPDEDDEDEEEDEEDEEEEEEKEGSEPTSYDPRPIYPTSKSPRVTEADEDLAREELIKSETDYDSFSGPDLSAPTAPTEEETIGIIDKMKGKKKMKTKADVGKTSLFTKWFEKYLNAVYSSFYKADGTLIIKPGHEGGFVNLDAMRIVLYEKLVIDLWESGVPPLLVFYHEIGHVLYTTRELNDYSKSLKPEIFKLLNWIEDFYIEDKIIKELYFIKPYIKMLHEVVPDFIDDWEKPTFALHYFYSYEGMTPRWMDKTKPDAIGPIFKRYIEQLKHLRASFSSKFAREKFIRMFEEFYMFCVKNGILTKKTPPPPLEPRPAKEKGEKGDGTGGGYDGKSEGSGGTYGEGEDESEGAAGEGTYADDEGEDVPESKLITPPFKPLDPVKGFDPVFKELMELLGKEYEKSLYDTFKLTKKGKPELVPITKPTSSPRSMVDPIAIATSRSDIYLEYTTEDFSYTAYNLFIDVSGSVGHNKTFNTLGRDIINIIKHYPYAVYGYGDDVTKWDQKRIDDILKLHCMDGTESPIIGDIILEKKELGNLNIILSDGDLGNLTRRKDISEITKQYLFVFVVSSHGGWGGYAEKFFDKKQWFVLNTPADLPAGLEHLKKYIASKGL